VTEALLVMLNNFFHDLAVAFLFASSLMSHLVLRHWPGAPSRRLAEILRRVAWGSLVWVLLGGAIRAWFYEEYEWLPSAGRNQVPVLVIKHIVLGIITLWGLVGVVKLERLIRGRVEGSSPE